LWRAKEDRLVLGSRLPREEPIDTVVVVGVPELGDRVVPVSVGGARGLQRVVVSVRNEHLAHDTDFWFGDVAIEPIRVVAMRRPALAVQVRLLAYERRRTQSREVVSVPRRILDAVGIVRRVPQWRVRALQWTKLH